MFLYIKKNLQQIFQHNNKNFPYIQLKKYYEFFSYLFFLRNYDVIAVGLVLRHHFWE